MGKSVNVESIFSEDFVPVVDSYVKVIKDALANYDCVVFMARKAICFYNALKESCDMGTAGTKGKRTSDGLKGRVLSSRALGYQIKELEAKKVALIDDVMISGASVLKAKSQIEALGCCCDVFVAALCTDIASKDAVAAANAIRQLDRRQVYLLAREITAYIQASAITNNVDQPMYVVEFSDPSSLRCTVSQESWFNLATETQFAFDVSNYTLCLDPSTAFQGLFDGILDPKEVMAKVRLFSHEPTISTVVPFVILPELSYVQIGNLFESVANEGLFDYVEGANLEETIKNKLRVVQYALSMYIAEHVITSLPGVEKREIDEYNELILFGKEIVSQLRPNPLSFAAVKRSIVPASSLSNSIFRHALSVVYRQLVISNPDSGKCDDSLRYSKRQALKDGYTTVAQATMLLRQELEHIGSSVREEVLISACFDSLVDRGIFVPFVGFHYEEGDIGVIRAFRGGEILALYECDLAYFGACLYGFMEATQEEGIEENLANRLGSLAFLKDGQISGKGKNREWYLVGQFYFDPFEVRLVKQGRSSVSLADLASKRGFLNLENGIVTSVHLDEVAKKVPGEIDRARNFVDPIAQSHLSHSDRTNDLVRYLIVNINKITTFRCLVRVAENIADNCRGCRENQWAIDVLEAAFLDARKWYETVKSSNVAAREKAGDDPNLVELLEGSGVRPFRMSMYRETTVTAIDERLETYFLTAMGSFLSDAGALIDGIKNGVATLEAIRNQKHRIENISYVGNKIESEMNRPEASIRFTVAEIAVIAICAEGGALSQKVSPIVSLHSRAETIVESISDTQDDAVFFCFMDDSDVIALKEGEDARNPHFKDVSPKGLQVYLEEIARRLISENERIVIVCSRRQNQDAIRELKRTAEESGVVLGIDDRLREKLSIPDAEDILENTGLRMEPLTIMSDCRKGKAVVVNNTYTSEGGPQAIGPKATAFVQEGDGDINIFQGEAGEDLLGFLKEVKKDAPEHYAELMKLFKQMELVGPIANEDADDLKMMIFEKFKTVVGKVGEVLDLGIKGATIIDHVQKLLGLASL